MDTYLKSLLSLLADEDDNIARAAMIELLDKYSEYLTIVLAELQENSDIIVRRRCHQLEALLSWRERRELLRKFIHDHDDSQLTIIDGLIYLHLLWFDKDSLLELNQTFDKFMQDFPLNKEISLRSIIEFFISRQQLAVFEGVLSVELYLIGSVLDSHFGSSSFFCAVILGIAERYGLENISVLRAGKNYYLCDEINSVIFSPADDWQEIKLPSDAEIEKVSKYQLIKYFAAIIFSNAVNSEEFRYIYVLGSILNSAENKNLNFLPYPYGRKTIRHKK